MIDSEKMAAAINSELEFAGYKRTEAFANVWRKEVKPGEIITRIYLNGKKANGYVENRRGVWELEKCNFSMLRDAVQRAIASQTQSELENMAR